MPTRKITDEDLNRAKDEIDKFTKVVNDTGRQIDAKLNDAAQSITRSRGTSKWENPTASGSGNVGGKTDREWKNHKWISRTRGKDGKWMYDYGGTVSGGNNQKKTNEGQARGNLRISADKATSHNTGSTPGLRAGLEVDRITRPVREAANDFGKTVTNGANFIADTVSEAVKKTPLRDLFK